MFLELICIRKDVFLSDLSHGCVCAVEMPSYDEEENCGVISTDAQGRWNNRDCSVALPYICKKRPNATLDPFTTGMCAVCVCVCEHFWLVVHI